jgi:hypothetical protein
MAFSQDRFSQGFKAASPINPKTIVTLVAGKDSQVAPLTNASQRPYGSVQATGATPGAGVAVYEAPSIVKAIAAASLGAGAEVSLASIGVASGAQFNQIATTTLLGPASVGASGAAEWAVGIAVSSAQAGEIFSVKLEPRQVSGLV